MTKFKKNDSLKQNNKNTFYFLTPQSALNSTRFGIGLKVKEISY